MLFTIFQCAASKAAMMSALIRPRGEISKPLLPAQSRIAFSCSADRPDPDVLAVVEVFVRGLPAEETFSATLIYGANAASILSALVGSQVDPIIGPLIGEGDFVSQSGVDRFSVEIVDELANEYFGHRESSSLHC